MSAELPPEIRTELVNALLLYRGIQRRHLFEYPNRADDSQRYIEESEVLIDKIVGATDRARRLSEPEDVTRFEVIGNQLREATGTSGLTSLYGGKVHMTLGEWERLVGHSVAFHEDETQGEPELTIWDIGSPQPESIVRVVEVDDTGEIRPSNSLHQYSNVWRKAVDTGRWMSHKGTLEVRDWDDLVRRYGPVAEFDQATKRSQR